MITNFIKKITNFFKSLFEIFIRFQTMGFSLIRESADDYRHFGLGFAVKNVLVGIFFSLIILGTDIFIICIIGISIHRTVITVHTKEIQYYQVTGTVINKTYNKAYTKYVRTGKMMVPIHHDEVYNVYVQYDEVSEVFNNKELFKQYAKNDSIPLILAEKLDKNDSVIEQTLELPD